MSRLDTHTKALINEIIQDCDNSLPSGFLYSINKRKVANAEQYYWRVKSASKGTRKFLRLDSEELTKYIADFDVEFCQMLNGIEKKLIIVNANLKYIELTKQLLTESIINST